MKPILAITAGDPNGVGYEVIIKTLIDPHICELCRPIVYGNAQIAKAHAHTLDEEYHNIQWNIIQTADQARDGRLNLITCYQDNTPLQIGVSTQEAGAAAFASLQRATQDLQQGKVDALVTAPINKQNIQSDAFRYSGHTEYLAHMFGQEQHSLMMMLSETMRVALVCNHAAISEVPSLITRDRIVEKLCQLNQSLKQDFQVRKPRIAVLALNPHAGDDGLIGKEEIEIIAPAIETAYSQHQIWAFGPYSADGFFGSGKYKHFDAVLAMYHDQGLSPFKALDMSGVNYTAGLSVVRTSPDHGTAYDLAGKNSADPTSMRHAIYAAVDILQTRTREKELNANPLVVTPREHQEQKERN